MSYLIKPANYKALLDLKQTELGIKQIKEFFQQNLSSELRLTPCHRPAICIEGNGYQWWLERNRTAGIFPY